MNDPNLLVLASLAEGDKHGYAMMADTRGFAGVDLGPGTLYGAISRLEARDFIKPLTAEDRRQRYRLTPAGRRHLEVQVAAMEPIVQAASRRLKLT